MHEGSAATGAGRVTSRAGGQARFVVRDRVVGASEALPAID